MPLSYRLPPSRSGTRTAVSPHLADVRARRVKHGRLRNDRWVMPLRLKPTSSCRRVTHSVSGSPVGVLSKDSASCECSLGTFVFSAADGANADGAIDQVGHSRRRSFIRPLPRRTTYTSSCFLCVWPAARNSRSGAPSSLGPMSSQILLDVPERERPALRHRRQ